MVVTQIARSDEAPERLAPRSDPSLRLSNAGFLRLLALSGGNLDSGADKDFPSRHLAPGSLLTLASSHRYPRSSISALPIVTVSHTMSAKPRLSQAKEPSHRTNSLGFAKIDCHTCTELKQKCDRKRPQCGTCLSDRRKCGGFAMNLMWKDPVVPNRSSNRQQQPRTRDDHRFKFVRGRPTRKRQPKESKSNSTGFEEMLKASASFSTWQLNGLEGTVSHAGDTCRPASSESSIGSSNDTLDMILDTLDADFTITNTSDCSQPIESIAQPIELETSLLPFDLTLGLPTYDDPTELVYASASNPEAIESTKSDGDGDALDIGHPQPLQVTYQNLAHKYQSVLNMYNEQFCVVPLSQDCPTNPFRVRTDFTESFTFLLHAVLAISSHHLAKMRNCSSLMDEMQKHWSTAIRLFSTALSHCNFSPLLDTLLILINIESTQSAYGMCDMHLRGAHKLLQESSAVETSQQSPRLRAQLAMLIWWDVTASLISRREPRLPAAYLETLAAYDDTDGWSFFTLNGCPGEFVRAMFRLAKLAYVYERTVSMEWTIFNRLPVDSIVDQVKSYINYEDANIYCTDETDADVNARRNRFHCIEAWRHAILLYVARVFTPKQDPSGLQAIDHHARVILDSVRCIPPTDPVQKQLLLPVFLGASEVGDDFNRSFVRQYCHHWSNEIHFYQFETVTVLLEDVWNDWDEATRDTYWWGVKTSHENRERPQQGNWMVQELLLG
ncbi:fungal specific transcription factor domain-containing [Fusarium albosuccineum]|uniref:Fungal specific transcription factor domain-containing n=1 Tax=Fusarium albosuccineum TaxID=1237068 RepID=A0A8H4KDW0_9HYPO|nr:fungal specific transcription factor domain-containing [Fusarium albosuccineum]